MRKRIMVATLIMSMVVALNGCGKKEESPNMLKDATKVVTLGEYKGLNLQVEDVTEEDVVEYINTNLLSPNASYEQIKEGTVKDGDTVNINYAGKIDGEAFEGGTDDSEDGTNLTIGSNSFIEGFEEDLIGVKVGDTVDLNLTFPKDYGKEELNGKDVVFTVTVNYICGDQITPELTDDFVAENTDYKTVDEYKANVKDTLKANSKTEAENNLWNQAVSNAKISEYSQDDIDKALSSMLSYYTNMASYYGMELGQLLTYYGTSEETFNEDMLETVKSMIGEKLVALAIADAENIELTDEVYNKKIDEFVTNYGYENADKLKEAVPEDEIKQQIYIELGKQFVIDNAVTKL